MPTAQPFTAIGKRGSGLTTCLRRVDVDDYHIWTTLGAINKNSGTPTEQQIADCISTSRQRVFDLYYNWHTTKGSSTLTVTDTEEPANSYQRSVTDLVFQLGANWDGDEVEPKERVCGVFAFKRVKSDPPGAVLLDATIATTLNTCDFVAMYLNDELIGYGLGEADSADARFAAIGAQAGGGTGCFTSVCIGGYQKDDNSAGWTDTYKKHDIAITTLPNSTNSDTYPVVCQAIARGVDGTQSPNASILYAGATSIQAGTINVSSLSQIDEIESWTY